MIRIITLLISTLLSINILAFGQTGHRVTGAVAEKYLTDEAKDAIEKILGNESLAEVANYVDEMKSEKDDLFWAKTAEPYHYVTVPTGASYADLAVPEKGDAIYALNKYAAIVKNPDSSTVDNALALKFIIHLIGDLHQPLHVGSGLDRGGNDTKVKFFGRNYNLHSVWDSGMINRIDLSYSEWTHWLNKHISKQDIIDWSSTDPLVWVKESHDLRQTIYPEDPNLSYEYLHQHKPALQKRLKQASIRIAVYLNELMANDKTQENK